LPKVGGGLYLFGEEEAGRMATTAKRLRAVIYGRNSTRRQEEAGTIETQVDFITNDPLVGARFGLLPRESWYLDTATSGSKKPLWERKHGKRLLTASKDSEREFDVIIVYKFNRLGRKAHDTEQAIEELLSRGVIIYDAKNQMFIDNNSATSKMIRQMLAIMSEFEASNDAEAMRDGQERIARAGKMLPSCIRLGYDWSAVDEHGRKAKGASLVIVPEEAKLVLSQQSYEG
jgi:DNA invertase Pin-like site-specific DNA recombinase